MGLTRKAREERDAVVSGDERNAAGSFSGLAQPGIASQNSL